MNNTRNPYVKNNGSPQLQKSVVAFVDILGFRELVKESFENGNGESLLNKLHTALMYPST